MKNILRNIMLFCAVLGLSFSLVSASAFAKTHKRHHAKHVTTHHVAKKHADNKVRTAQRHLANLGYYTGTVDGKVGPLTKKSIKAFQREHGLKPDGILGTRTYNAILSADRGTQRVYNNQVREFLPTPTAINEHADQQYPAPMIVGSADPITSRFARLSVSETSEQRYTVSLNGQPVLSAEDQPSIIGVSRSYNLGDEDAILFTVYHGSDPTCVYKHILLTINSSGNQTHEITNCTSGYQAKAVNGSLFISFPQTDTNSAVGSMWRYEKGDLEKL